jgi:hypothetical protein
MTWDGDMYTALPSATSSYVSTIGLYWSDLIRYIWSDISIFFELAEHGKTIEKNNQRTHPKVSRKYCIIKKKKETS